MSILQYQIADTKLPIPNCRYQMFDKFFPRPNYSIPIPRLFSETLFIPILIKWSHSAADAHKTCFTFLDDSWMILQYFHFSLEHFMVIFGQVFCGVQPGCTCFNLWIHGVRRNLEKKIEGESRNAAKRRLTVSFYGKLKLMFLTSNAVPVSFLYRIVENRAGLKGIMGGRGEPPLKTSQYFIRLGKTSTLIFLYNISPKSEHFKSWFLPWCKHAADASNTADALMLLMCQCYSYADAVCPILEKGSFFMKIWAKYEHFINKKYEQNTTKKHAKYGENMSKIKVFILKRSA